MDIYAENILDHYKHPRHAGMLDDASVMHAEKNLSCGDEVSLQLKIEDGIIRELAWTGQGCAISQAGMSILSEELIGKTVEEASALSPDHVTALLGVPVGTRRLKCALLCLHALKNALHAYKGEPTQSWHETVGQE
jgi:nitrogen fixation protein NifU and related proteins